MRFVDRGRADDADSDLLNADHPPKVEHLSQGFGDLVVLAGAHAVGSRDDERVGQMRSDGLEAIALGNRAVKNPGVTLEELFDRPCQLILLSGCGLCAKMLRADTSPSWSGSVQNSYRRARHDGASVT